MVEEHRAFARLGGLAKRQPVLYPGYGHGTNRTKAFTSALATHLEQLLIGIKIIKIQADQLAHAKPAAIERFEHRAVANTQWGVERNRIEQPNHFVHAE